MENRIYDESNGLCYAKKGDYYLPECGRISAPPAPRQWRIKSSACFVRKSGRQWKTNNSAFVLEIMIDFQHESTLYCLFSHFTIGGIRILLAFLVCGF